MLNKIILFLIKIIVLVLLLCILYGLFRWLILATYFCWLYEDML
ncbi:unknown [Prevotella sp. CAG:1185]|nr:unknown [Prevotella sp. CAG:1185]